MTHSQAIIEHLRQDTILERCLVIDTLCPLLEPARNTSLFTELSQAIISQQLHPKAAKTIYQRFLALFSAEPNPTELLTFSSETLRSPGLSLQKATYLTDLAEKITMQTIPGVEVLAEWDDQAIIQVLTQVKGVGEWTAQMFLIFRLHRLDILPTKDLGIRKKMQQLYSLEMRPLPPQMEKIAAPWRPYRSIACWYLWQWS